MSPIGTWCERHVPSLGLPSTTFGPVQPLGRHELVHFGRFIALDEVWRVTVAAEERLQLVPRDARQHRGAGDLVTVQVQHGQHRPVVDRMKKLVRVPARGQRAGLRLAIADHAGHEQVGIVERRAERVRQRITQLAALVNRARRLRRDVARNAAREGELFEQPPHPVLVLGDVGIDFAVGAFQVGVRHQPGPAVARPGDINDVEVVLLDHAVQVGIDKVEPRGRAPVAQQARFDVRQLERLLQQRIVVEINLSDREVVGRAPPGVQLAQRFRSERFRLCFHG